MLDDYYKNRIAPLLAKNFVCQQLDPPASLSAEEQKELEDWAAISDKNMRIYLNCMDMEFMKKKKAQWDAIEVTPDAGWKRVLEIFEERKAEREGRALLAVSNGLVTEYFMARIAGDEAAKNEKYQALIALGYSPEAITAAVDALYNKSKQK